MDPQLWAFVVVAVLLAVTPGADTLLGASGAGLIALGARLAAERR